MNEEDIRLPTIDFMNETIKKSYNGDQKSLEMSKIWSNDKNLVKIFLEIIMKNHESKQLLAYCFKCIEINVKNKHISPYEIREVLKVFFLRYNSELWFPEYLAETSSNTFCLVFQESENYCISLLEKMVSTKNSDSYSYCFKIAEKLLEKTNNFSLYHNLFVKSAKAFVLSDLSSLSKQIGLLFFVKYVHNWKDHLTKRDVMVLLGIRVSSYFETLLIINPALGGKIIESLSIMLNLPSYLFIDDIFGHEVDYFDRIYKQFMEEIPLFFSNKMFSISYYPIFTEFLKHFLLLWDLQCGPSYIPVLKNIIYSVNYGVDRCLQFSTFSTSQKEVGDLVKLIIFISGLNVVDKNDQLRSCLGELLENTFTRVSSLFLNDNKDQQAYIDFLFSNYPPDFLNSLSLLYLNKLGYIMELNDVFSREKKVGLIYSTHICAQLLHSVNFTKKIQIINSIKSICQTLPISKLGKSKLTSELLVELSFFYFFQNVILSLQNSTVNEDLANILSVFVIRMIKVLKLETIKKYELSLLLSCLRIPVSNTVIFSSVRDIQEMISDFNFSFSTNKKHYKLLFDFLLKISLVRNMDIYTFFVNQLRFDLRLSYTCGWIKIVGKSLKNSEYIEMSGLLNLINESILTPMINEFINEPNILDVVKFCELFTSTIADTMDFSGISSSLLTSYHLIIDVILKCISLDTRKKRCIYGLINSILSIFNWKDINIGCLYYYGDLVFFELLDSFFKCLSRQNYNDIISFRNFEASLIELSVKYFDLLEFGPFNDNIILEISKYMICTLNTCLIDNLLLSQISYILEKCLSYEVVINENTICENMLNACISLTTDDPPDIFLQLLLKLFKTLPKYLTDLINDITKCLSENRSNIITHLFNEISSLDGDISIDKQKLVHSLLREMKYILNKRG